jgi:hypothetical protein
MTKSGYGNTTHTLTIPSGKQVTKITFSGYTNTNYDVLTYISDINGNKLGASEYLYNNSTSLASTYTFVLSEPATESLTFTIASVTNATSQACLKIYVTYKDAE